MSLFNDVFLVSFLLMPIGLITVSISKFCSDIDKYTKDFLSYIRNKVNNAKTLDELNVILSEFEFLAIENKQYNLSYPLTLRELHYNILNRIDILNKQIKHEK